MLWDFQPDCKPSKIFVGKEIVSIIINILFEIAIVLFCLKARNLGNSVFSTVFLVLFSFTISLFIFITLKKLISSSEETEFCNHYEVKRSLPYFILMISYMLLIIIYAI